MTDTLSKMKMKRNITLVTVFIVLACLIAYSVVNPEPEDEQIKQLKTEILARNPGEMTNEERREMRRMVDQLSPETRKRLIREVMRGRLEQMREETADMTVEQKRERINEAVLTMRKRFSEMTPDQKTLAKERINSPEGKERMKEALDFYYKEFTPEEREMLDPLVEEFTIQMER